VWQWLSVFSTFVTTLNHYFEDRVEARRALVHTCSAIRHCKQSEYSNKYRLQQVYTMQVDLHLVNSAACCTFVHTTVVCIVFMRNGNVLLVDCQLCQPAVYCTYVVC
jgi:hypothetical protein